MRLIEKKCPNCGAGLEFSDNDKSCKCQYCHRAFEIERDSSLNVADIAEQFNLSELKGTAGTAAKVIGGVVIGHYIVAAFIGLLGFAMFGFIGYNVYKQFSSDDIVKKDVGDGLLADTKDLSNQDVESIEWDSASEISHSAKGVNNAYHSYMLDGDVDMEKIYVAYKEGSNYLIVLYKGIYKDFFHQESKYTLYMPIVYENVKKKNIQFDLANGKLKAPEYHFGDDGSSYYYGYASFDEAYNDVVKPLEEEYKISEK